MYEVYSLHGKLLHRCDDRAVADRMLDMYFNAKCLIQVHPDGRREILRERKELN